MNAIIFFLLIDTIAQLLLCRFSLWWLVSLICRLLFCARIIGVLLKVKKLVIAEAFNFGAMFLYNALFHKNSMPWMSILAYLLMSLIAVGLEYLDDLLYVYTIEDVEDDI